MQADVATGRMETFHDFVLFDLDGTLSDPLVGIARSLNHALAHLGCDTLETSEVPAYVGPPLDEAFRTITGFTDTERVDALVTKYRERYADVGYSENVLYPGIADALAALHGAGVPMGVCTSKRRDFAQRILDMFGLRSCFRFVDGGDVGVKKWQQVERLCELGLVGQSSVMVGDRSFDIVAAHRNGLSAAGVLWGHGSRAELEREGPRYLLQSPRELASLVMAEHAGDASLLECTP
jgi:phosphoglycolate phosphatase